MNCIHTVLVQNSDGKPLSPTRPAKAKWLLKHQKARVTNLYPFTIRLTYQVSNPIYQPTKLKQDDGKTTGYAVVQENKTHNRVLCTVQVKTRGEEISDTLVTRKRLRAGRRNRRNKKAGREGIVKIAYRHGQEYPPSIRADVQAKVNIAKRLIKSYPVTEILLEAVKIDLVKVNNPGVTGIGYQQGLSYGITAGSTNQKRRLAILNRDGYRCLYCGTPVTADTAHIHHFIQRKHGGTKRYDIQGTLCKKCHTGTATADLALCLDTDSYPTQRAAGRCMQGRYLLEKKLSNLGVPLTVKYGYETHQARQSLNLPKSHTNDAIAIGTDPGTKHTIAGQAWQVKLHARHGGRKLFDVNPGVAAYRGKANRQDHVDKSRMKVDEHTHEQNKQNRSYRRHIRNKYYKKLKAQSQYNYDLLPGKNQLHEVFTVNRAILLTQNGTALVKNQRIKDWKYNNPWPKRHRVIERYDLVKTAKGDIGIVTSIMSNCTARVDFVKKRKYVKKRNANVKKEREEYKTNFSFYKPEKLKIIQKSSSQTWISM